MADNGEVMDGWGNPDRERGEQSFAWLHVPARGTLRVVMLSRAPVRYRGHWVDGRMRPCRGGSDCLYCERRMGGQVRYAFSVLDLDARACALIELGAAAAGEIKRAADEAGFLRGLAFQLRKDGGRERGRVLVTSQNAVVNIGELPDAPDPREHLMRSWGASVGEIMEVRNAVAEMFR